MPTLFGRNTEARTHSFCPEHYHKKMIRLSDEDRENYKHKIQTIIESDDEEEQMVFSKENLSKFDPLSTFKLAENFPDFEAFCQHDDYPHAKAWASLLKENGHIYFEMVALDGKNVCTIYDIFVNSTIDKHLKETMDEKEPALDDTHARTFWMTEGCKYNSYHALCCRAKIEVAKIQSAMTDEESVIAEIREEKSKSEPQYSQLAKQYFAEEIAEVEAVLSSFEAREEPLIIPSHSAVDRKLDEYNTNLDETLNTISDLYLSLGHMFAAKRYYELGHFFSGLETDEARVLSLSYYMKGAAKFFAGEYLFKKQFEEDGPIPEDKLILSTITQGKGLSVFGYDDLADAGKDIIHCLPSRETALKIRADAITKMEKGIEARRHKMENLPKALSVNRL